MSVVSFWLNTYIALFIRIQVRRCFYLTVLFEFHMSELPWFCFCLFAYIFIYLFTCFCICGTFQDFVSNLGYTALNNILRVNM